MRFQRIGVDRFGPLEDVEWAGDGSRPALMVVLGPNEAGKSAFHQLLATLLYGFYPASREGNPWAPWAGSDIDIQACLRLEDGTTIEIHRRLLSTPWAQIQREGTVERLGNDDLPFVRHVQRDVFLQVYALTLAELSRLEGRGWESVQDRLVVGMGSQDVRPPREVMDEWTRTAQSLWRPDRRGTPRHRRILDALRDLRERRRKAVDRDRELRMAERTAAELARERESLRDRRAELDEHLEGARRLLPVRERLRRIEQLRARAGDPRELEALPSDPGARLGELDERIRLEEEDLARLEERLREARKRAGRLTDEDRAVMKRSSELRELANRAHILQERAARRGKLEEEIRGLERRIHDTASPLMEASPASLSADVLDTLQLPELERRVQAAGDARASVERARDGLRAVQERPLPAAPPHSLTLGLVLIPVSAALLALGIAAPEAGRSALGVVSGLLALLVGAWMLQRWGAGRAARDQRDREMVALGRALAEAEEELELRDREARAPLEGLPLREEARGRPTASLVSALDRLRELLRDLQDRTGARHALSVEDRRTAEALSRVRRELLPDLPADPVTGLPELAGRLRDLDRKAEKSRAAGEEAEALERERKLRLERLESLREGRETLRTGIRTAAADAGEGLDEAEAVDVAAERLRALADLRREEEELPREFPDLELLRRRIRAAEEEGAAWLDGEGVAPLETERGAIQERMEDLGTEVESLRQEIGHLADEETPDLLDGEILRLEEELVRVRKERDRLHLLCRLLARAEQRFREEHQPDLLRRAEEYLSRITGGRYSRLVLGDREQTPTFHVQAPHLPRLLPVAPPLSTGTCEQVYLALRLAIVDHLDEGREPLPLFLDEVLVNWDRDRRARGLDVLAEVAARRQVFLFTCHPELAREVEERNGSLLCLGSPDEEEAGAGLRKGRSA